MPPRPGYESENPKEVKRNSPDLYRWFQNNFKQTMTTNRDVDYMRQALANVLAGQMLAEDPKLAPLKQKQKEKEKDPKLAPLKQEKKKDGKTITIYYEDEPVTNMVHLGSQIHQSSYFERWAAKKTEDELLEAAEHPAKTLEEVQKVQRQEKYHNDLQQEAKSFYEAMQATGTGRNWLGIRRKSNSPEYDRMMDSIGAVVNCDLQNKTLEEQEQDMDRAVAATKKYLADKMSVRKTEDGAIRWENAMRFLQLAMPAEKFKAYCDEVNEARAEEDKIIPEQFAPPRTAERTVELAQKDMRDKGQITVQDAAKVAAAYDLSKSREAKFEYDKKLGKRKLDPEQFKNHKIPPLNLAIRTEEIARDEEFQKWFREQGKDVLHDDMTKGHDGLGARIGHWSDPRPQDKKLTNQLKAQREAEMARKHQENVEIARKNQVKAERKELFNKLKTEQPEDFEKLNNEYQEIKGLMKTDPEAYEKRKNAFNKEMDRRIAEDKKRQAGLNQNEPQKQEQKGPQKEKPKGGPALGV